MDIKEIRKRIDATDEQLAELLAERMKLAADVAAYKKENGMAVYDAQREKEVIERVSRSAGETFAPYIAEIYETIMKTSKDYQNDLIG